VRSEDDFGRSLLGNLEKRRCEQTLVGGMKMGVRLVKEEQAGIVHRGIGYKLNCL
jgi:hypothetical protein